MFAVASLARRLKAPSRNLQYCYCADLQYCYCYCYCYTGNLQYCYCYCAELATHSARISTRQARSMRAVSNEDDLSAELIPCDRADSHGQYGSATMLMAWRSVPPCAKVLLEEQTSGTSWTSNGALSQKSATEVTCAIAVRVSLPSPICDGIPGAPSSWSPKAHVLRRRTP